MTCSASDAFFHGSLQVNLSQARNLLNQKLAMARNARETIRKENKNLSQARKALAAVGKARDVLQALAVETQNELHAQLSAIVTDCLHTVFGPRYTFRLKFAPKRGKSEPSFTLESDGNEIDPLSAAGGGVVDVAAFALRVGALVLTGNAQTLILDEPFKFVSEGHRELIGEMLEGLSQSLGIQIILVTHLKELEMGLTIPLEQSDKQRPRPFFVTVTEGKTGNTYAVME